MEGRDVAATATSGLRSPVFGLRFTTLPNPP
jgi:hypothetical protein